MLPPFVLQQFVEDSEILLKRALLGKTLACFGIDGHGLYGQSTLAKHFNVLDIEVKINHTADDDLEGKAYIALLGYDAKDCGHAATDVNLKISVNEKFKVEYIDTTCWTWADLPEQGDCYFTINFDVEKLLS